MENATANQDTKNATPWKPYSQVIAGERKYIAGRIIDPSKVEGGSNVMFYGGYTTDKEKVEKLCNELNEVPEWAEHAKNEGFTYRPAEHLPDGWGWRDHDDGSGSLVSPEGDSVISYDISTNEYKIDGKWNFMDDASLDREYFEKLAFSKYVQIATTNETQINQNEKETDFMSKFELSARVNPLPDQSGKVKAMASVTIDNAIAINSLTIVEGNNGHFVGYPQSKDGADSYRDIVEFMRDSEGKMTKDALELKEAIQKLLVDMHKNGERATPEVEGQVKVPVMHEIKAYVTPLRDSENATRGLATVQVGEMFKINSVRVNENTKEGSENFGKNFVAMPSRPDKTTESGYRDVVHPVNAAFGEKLRDTVLKQYDTQVQWKNHMAVKEQRAQAAQKDKPALKKPAQEDIA